MTARPPRLAAESLLVLRALADACADEPAGAPASDVAERIARYAWRPSGAATRTVLRRLRRAGYVASLPDRGERVLWRLTEQGQGVAGSR